jgi:hypothetical protein
MKSIIRAQDLPVKLRFCPRGRPFTPTSGWQLEDLAQGYGSGQKPVAFSPLITAKRCSFENPLPTSSTPLTM